MATALTDLQGGEELVESPPRKSRKKLLLALVVLLAAGGAAAWFFLLGGGEEPAGDQAPVDGPVVDVEQMTANLAGPEIHYARFAFAVVLAEGKVAGDVEPRFALLKDAALSEVQQLTTAQLLTPDGADHLRTRLTERAQEIYPDGEVLRVVLTELIVQ